MLKKVKKLKEKREREKLADFLGSLKKEEAKGTGMHLFGEARGERKLLVMH